MPTFTSTWSSTAAAQTGTMNFTIFIRPPEDPGAAAMAVLGIPPDTPPDGVRKAFRASMKTAHPDVGGTPEDARRVLSAYQELQRLGRAS